MRRLFTGGHSYHIVCLILNSEIVECGFILVLCGQTGVDKIAIDVSPLTQSSVIEQLQFVGDNEWNDATTQALFEHDKTTYSTISILERMNTLKTYMQVKNIFKLPFAS